MQHMSMIIDPYAPIYALYGIILQIICSVFSDKNEFAFMRKAFYIVLDSVCSIIWCRPRNAEICGYRNTQIIETMCNVRNLTLFPRDCFRPILLKKPHKNAINKL